MNKLIEYWNNLTAAVLNRKTDNHIFVKSFTDIEDIVKPNIALMTLSADCQNRPQMILTDEHGERSRTYHFPIYEGLQVHICNEFLRSLNTGIDVEFITYMQYSELIESIFEQIKG